jgi:uroporphyrinogen-III synthase
MSSTSTRQTRIVLLKDDADGRYERAFANNDHRYSINGVSLVTTNWLDDDNKISDDVDLSTFKLVMFTSARGVEAFKRRFAVGGAVNSKLSLAAVVGVASERALSSLQLFRSIVGSQSGSAGKLARWIVDEQLARSGDSVLWMCGAERMSDAANVLRDANVDVVECVCYEKRTRSVESFDALSEGDDDDDCSIRWIVFFAPSAVRCNADAIGRLDSRYRIAAIGPSTAAALGNRVDAVAAEPTPEALRDAIDSHQL